MLEPVAITGLGIACALGTDRDTVARGCRAGTRPFAPVRRFDASSFRVDLAAEVPPLDFAARFSCRALRNTSRCDHLALWAAADAIEQAGVSDTGALHSAGIFVGASTGGMAEMEAAVRDGTPARLPLAVVWAYPVWATARCLARTLAIGGPVATYMTACSSAAHALGIAMHRLRRGDLDLAVAGGTEATSRLTLAGFGSLGVLDPAGTRPFAADRRGITLGEGAAFFVLERASAAQRRNAPIYALLSGYGAAADASHMVQPRDDGQGALAAMGAALADAGLTAADIDYINAHGTGTVQNDAMEARAIAALTAGHPARVSSSKSMLGHALGAAAALEGAVTVLAMAGGFVPPNAGIPDASETLALGDSELAGAVAPGSPPPRVALSSSFAFGGNNAALVFEAGERLDAAMARRQSRRSRAVHIYGAALTSVCGAASDADSIASLLGHPTGTELDPKGVLSPRTARRMDPLSARAAATAVLAAQSAGFDTSEPGRLGVGFGTSFGALDATASFLARLWRMGAIRVNPLEFPNLVHNAAAGYASIALGACGPSVTACQQQLAGDEALAAMGEALAAGRVDRVVCGGGDLAAECLDRGYATVARHFDLPAEHHTVVGALALAAGPGADGLTSPPWAEVLASVSAGPHAGLRGAIETACSRAGLAPDRAIDLWLDGAINPDPQRHAAAVAPLPLLRDGARIKARIRLGNADGAGIAVIALGAAYIATGRSRTVLVTATTDDGSAHATVLGAPRLAPADDRVQVRG